MWKRIGLLLALLLALATVVQAQYTSTTNLGLKKPNAGVAGWDTYINGNFDVIDALLTGINTLSVNSTTPSVANAYNWKTNNSSATVITNFTSGYSGQTIYVLCGDSNTTINSTATISVQEPFVCNSAIQNSIQLMLSGTVWVELDRSYISTRVLGFVWGDAATGSALTTAEVGYVTVPFSCTITGWHIMADAGTVTVKTARVNGGTALPTVGSNSISTSGVALATGTKIDSTTVSDFTSTAIATNDTLGFFITAVATAKQITFQLDCAQ